MLSKLSQIISQPCIAVDLGTANTRIYTSQQGELTEKPSSISLTAGKTNNFSDDYLEYINNRLSTKPLRCGVVVDLKNATMLLKPLIKNARKFLMAPVTLASAPTDTTENERDLLRKALVNAGASHVSIIPEVWAAAIGAGINIAHSNAQLLIDIGDGVTDMAIFRDGRIIYSSSVRIACSDLQKSIRSALMSKYKLMVYDHEAERLTHEVLSISKSEEHGCESVGVAGIDVMKRCKTNILVNKNYIISSIEPVLNKITKMIEDCLKILPDKIYCEILESGISLTGGGACIDGMDIIIALKTKMEVRIAPDPIHAVINGAVKTLNYWNGKKNWWENISWPKLPA
ncbi:MAG: rod shape-determining protein [Desulfotalea sp.]